MDKDAQREKLTEIEHRIERLKKELDVLWAEKSALTGSRSPSSSIILGKSVAEQIPSTSEEKIALFLTLFKCRESVYPTFWENPSKGSKGYSPACRNEWVRGICDKPKVKCSECPNQDFPSLDRIAVQQHLMGKQIIGTYAIREDDSCTFLACDFDGNGWTEDVLAYVGSARDMGVEAYVERSRSGNGAHVWIFFSEPLAAQRARRLGTVILAKATARRPNMKLKSYDRFFPSQDTLPKGGFGNLIALPLQKRARERGNTEFLKDDFTPFENQWEFLSRVRRLSLSDVISLLTTILPPQASLLPQYESIELQDAERLLGSSKHRIGKNCYTGALDIEIGAQVRIQVGQLPSNLISALRRTAIFANPEFFRKQRMRFSTWDTPRYVCCDELLGDSLILPRGVLDQCIDITRTAGSELRIIDSRPKRKKVGIHFTGELSTEQVKSVEKIEQYDFGLLVAPPGAGKTVMACALIAKRDLKTLVLVHTKALLEQWRARIAQFLDVAEIEVEVIGKKSKKKKQEAKISIATLQTLRNLENAAEVLGEFGHVIVDECHHVAAVSFEAVLKLCPAKHVLGLTATPYRKDGHQAIIHMQCGPIRAEMNVVDGIPLRKRVVVRKSSFSMGKTNSDPIAIHEVWEKLVCDPDRLELIATDILQLLKEGRFPIVLSERKNHLEALGNAIQRLSESDVIRPYVFVGGLGKKAHLAALENISKDRVDGFKPFILATGAFVGEGFDLPFLDTLILAMPISFKGKLVQYSGRLHRPSPGKTEVQIWDYFDADNPLTV